MNVSSRRVGPAIGGFNVYNTFIKLIGDSILGQGGGIVPVTITELATALTITREITNTQGTFNDALIQFLVDDGEGYGNMVEQFSVGTGGTLRVVMRNLPNSKNKLTSGQIWNDNGTLKIV
jgi:hypothetical protein